MDKLNIFIPLTKVDVEKRLVFGTIAQEIPDRANEIMDYPSARPEFEKWSSDIEKASDGKSVGNLRAMHGNVAAGKLTAIHFDDAAKRIECCGKIVDDGEWLKILEGVYTGFSMGGKYLKRWKDTDNPQLTRYTPAPTEVSLVDNPCIPTATFEVIKTDGSTELRKFKPREPNSTNVAPGVEQSHVQKVHDLAQAIHDNAVDLGADCNGDGASEGDTEGDDGEAEKLAKLGADNTALLNIIGALKPQVDDLVKRVKDAEAEIERLNARPAPGGPVIAGTRTITKGQDAEGLNGFNGDDPVSAFEKHLDTLSPSERALALMKFSLANPLAAAPSPRR
ncbi:MAG TPA: hypothetical protein VHT03_01530 [Rhizomicrobium sp.]|jgi:hypothetical protein|nr:hypothetical protein [Rhizomicrobium sp.]